MDDDLRKAADAKPRDIGEAIRRQRVELGMSIPTAERAAGLEAGRWEHMETGDATSKGRGPSIRVLERAANVLGLTIMLVPLSKVDEVKDLLGR
jgi:transcriptional regulator with XRE-family HTH domain